MIHLTSLAKYKFLIIYWNISTWNQIIFKLQCAIIYQAFFLIFRLPWPKISFTGFNWFLIYNVHKWSSLYFLNLFFSYIYFEFFQYSLNVRIPIPLSVSIFCAMSNLNTKDVSVWFKIYSETISFILFIWNLAGIWPDLKYNW